MGEQIDQMSDEQIEAEIRRVLSGGRWLTSDDAVIRALCLAVESDRRLTTPPQRGEE